MELHFLNQRPAPDVLAQPEVQLHHWRILQRGNGTLHIAAQLDSGPLRVTSLLQAIDLPRAIVKTESGRSYHLCSPPEEDQLLRSLMVLNAARDLVQVSGDVSYAIWAATTTGEWPDGGAGLLPLLQWRQTSPTGPPRSFDNANGTLRISQYRKRPTDLICCNHSETLAARRSLHRHARCQVAPPVHIGLV